MGFKQVNYEVWMLFNGAVNNFKVCPLEEDPSCSDSLKYYNNEDHINYFGMDAGCWLYDYIRAVIYKDMK